ncbi:porin family protein [Cupriavidus basilensis]
MAKNYCKRAMFYRFTEIYIRRRLNYMRSLAIPGRLLPIAPAAMLVLLSVVPAHAAAAELAANYWYVGGDLNIARDKVSTGTPGWAGGSSNNVGLGLRGGYQFSPYVSVEGSLASLGRVVAKNGSANDKFDVNALSVNVVGHLPLTERFSLLGIAGVNYMHGRRSGDLESSNKSQGLISLGVGASYAVTQNWRLRMQYMNYGKLNWKGNDASVKSQAVSLGVDYLFR